MKRKILAIMLAAVLIFSSGSAAFAATLSSSWVPLSATETTVVDTLNGVDALYEPDYDRQCNDYAIRYYAEVYGVDMFVGVMPPFCAEQNCAFRTLAAGESPVTGDIVYWTAEQNNGRNAHTAIVKSYTNGVITLIEQNWKWQNQAAKDRKIKWNAAAFSVYRHAENKPSFWAAGDIEQAGADGLLDAVSGASWQENITRAQFCGLVTRAARNLGMDVDFTYAVPFVDTDDPYIAAAYKLNIVTGRSADTFVPAGLITREELSTMVLRLIRAAGQDGEIEQPDYTPFTDAGRINTWAKESMAYCVGRGVIQGTSATTLSPQGYATVEQAIVILMRITRDIRQA